MKFVFASDSFKGSLSSRQIAEILEKSARKHFPVCEIRKVAVADGGEGTVAAVVENTGGFYREVEVTGPLCSKVHAAYGILPDKKVIIEMAAASGLPLIPESSRNVMDATTYGTGELIRDALEQGYRDIILAIGGSATNDGGMGAMCALGIQFLDRDGKPLKGIGKNLERVCSIDSSHLYPGAYEAHFTLMCDVKNPLLGPNGATYTYGSQKGASPLELATLEKGMENYARVVNEAYGMDVGDIPGGGAAGGLGAACMAFLKATPHSGIETLLELVNFEDIIKQSDAIITGEGQVDRQSSYGKVLSGIGQYGLRKKIPVYAIVGSMGEGAEKLYDCGITSILPVINRIMTLEQAIQQAEELYEGAADRLFRIMKGCWERAESL